MPDLPPRDAIVYRLRRPEDTPFLRYVYGTTRDEEMQRVPWTDEQKANFLDMQFRAQREHYDDYYPTCEFLVIEIEGKPAGRLYIDRREKLIEIIDIVLLPEFRGRGIGRMLIQEILDEGNATSRPVRIYVENFNPARHLYDRLGFQHIDTNGVYHLMEWKR
jgi:ribosomal protein S18 acetylase RimI-like enzyme